MEYSSSTQMENQMESGTQEVVTEEEINDRYITVANAADRREPSVKAMRSKDSVKEEISLAEVENTDCQESAKPDKDPIMSTSSCSHVKKEETNNDECSQDGDTNEAGLRKGRHVESNTTEAKNDCDGGQFGCLDCTAVFETNAAFQEHIAFHEGYRRYKCTVCEQRLTTKQNLMVHLRRHTGERPFKCDVCEKKFTTNSDLTAHKRYHILERPFGCDICEKKFTKSGHLTTHKRTHTGERPFKCDICDKKCTTNGHLIEHKRIHTGDKPFKCLVCHKRFTQSGVLQRHNLTHTGEKPFKCDICEKKFATSNELKRHKNVHSGEKPYKCPTSGECFSRKDRIQRHKRTQYAGLDAGTQPDVSHLQYLPTSTPQADASRESSPMEDFIIIDEV